MVKVTQIGAPRYSLELTAGEAKYLLTLLGHRSNDDDKKLGFPPVRGKFHSYSIYEALWKVTKCGEQEWPHD